MTYRFCCLAGAFALLAFGLNSNPAGAGMISYSASGTGSDRALSATADFTTSAGVIDVTLTNTLAADIIRSRPGTERHLFHDQQRAGDAGDDERLGSARRRRRKR